jgi:hypothetical protein
MIKSGRMRLTGHVVHIRKMKNACKVSVKKPERKL